MGRFRSHDCIERVRLRRIGKELGGGNQRGGTKGNDIEKIMTERRE